jgi:tetratricopeptide (TPR) repeat protein
LKENPDNIFLNQALFSYYFGKKRGSRGDRRNSLKRADFYLKKLLLIDRGNSLRYLQDRIDLYLYYKKYNRAEKICLNAMREFPKEEKLRTYLGRIYNKSGNYQQLEIFTNKMKLNESGSFHYLMFLTMMKNTQNEKALGFLEKWLEIKEMNGNMTLEDCLEKFWFLYKRKIFGEAQKYCAVLKEKFIDDKKSLFDIHNIEAFLFERNGHFREAKAVYTFLASKYPWLGAHYQHKMKIREFGTIGPWLTKFFSGTTLEPDIFRFTKRDFTFGGRSKIFYDMIQSIKESPFFGKGYEGFLKRKIPAGSYAPRVRHAHNGYLKNINELGLIGFALLFWVVVDLFLKLIRLVKSNHTFGVLLLTLFVSLTLLNLYYTLFLCINFALIIFNFLIFTALYSEKKVDF